MAWVNIAPAIYFVLGVGLGSALTFLSYCRYRRMKKLSEAQAILDALPDPVFVFPFPVPGARFTHFNQSASQFLGMTMDELFLAGPCQIDEMPPEKRHHLKENLESHRFVRFETSLIHKTGEVLPVEICASIITLSGQTVIVSTARSLEDQKRYEIELETANQQLRQTLHILCHDLANPLGALNGLLRIYTEENRVSHAELVELLHISDQTLDLIKLVRELRRIEEGKTEIRLTEVSLTQIVQRAIQTIQPRLDKKALRIQTTLDDSLRVHMEPISFLNSVLANLLTNAVKFSHPGGSIFVTTKSQGESIVVEIRDQGIGMSSDLLSRIFNPAERTSRDGTSGESGTGFGMPLVKKFMELYGGSILISSKQKNQNSGIASGTTVTLSFPTKGHSRQVSSSS